MELVKNLVLLLVFQVVFKLSAYTYSILNIQLARQVLLAYATPVINNIQADEVSKRAISSANIPLKTSQSITALLYNTTAGTDGDYIVPFTISNIDTTISSSYALILVDKNSESVQGLTTSSFVMFSDSKVYLAKNIILVGKISSGKSLGGRFSLSTKPSDNLIGFFFYTANLDYTQYGLLQTTTKSAICHPYLDFDCKGVDTMAAYLPKREWFEDRVVNTSPQSYGLVILPLGPPGTANFLKANTMGYRNNPSDPYWPYYPAGQSNPQTLIGGLFYPDSMRFIGYQSTIDFYWEFLNNQKFYDTMSAYSTYYGGAPIKPLKTPLGGSTGPYANVLSMDYDLEMTSMTILSAKKLIVGKYIENSCMTFSSNCLQSFIKWKAENGYIKDNNGQNIIGKVGNAQIVAINLAPYVWVNSPDAGGMLCRDICGFHDVVTLSSGQKLYYTVTPYANEYSCPSCFNIQQKTMRSIKVIASHELAEVMTRIALQDKYILGAVAEISDPCSWQYSDVPSATSSNITCTFQPLWSFQSNSCVRMV